MILALVLGSYLSSVVFVAVQLRRAPLIENDPPEESRRSIFVPRPAGVPACTCRRCALRRTRRVSRSSVRHVRRRGTRRMGHPATLVATLAKQTR